LVNAKIPKICMILTNQFAPDVRVFKEAEYLTQNGYSIEILAWDRQRQNRKAIEEVSGIKIVRFYFYSVPGTGLLQLWPYIKFLLACINYTKKNRYEYIHCHDLDGGIIGLLLKKRSSKLVFDMHEYYEGGRYKKINSIIHFFVSFIQKCSYKTIYVNKQQLFRTSKKNRGKLVFLPNYPEREWFTTIKIPSEILRINYIGTVRDYKAIMTLIEAVIGDDRVMVTIYGDGAALPLLKEKYSNIQNVHFYGTFNGQRESKYIYQQTDLLYCVFDPSVENWRYAYPIKFFEAIVSGTPVLVSSNSIVEQEVLAKNIGSSVIYGDVFALKAIISKMLLTSYVLDGYRSEVLSLQDTYSWSVIKHNLNKVYPLL